MPRRCVPALAIAAAIAVLPATAGARPADAVTARWQDYDAKVKALSPAERASLGGDRATGGATGSTPARPVPQDGGDPVLPIAGLGLVLVVAAGGGLHVLTRARQRPAPRRMA